MEAQTLLLNIPSFPNNVVVELKAQKNNKKNHTLPAMILVNGLLKK